MCNLDSEIINQCKWTVAAIKWSHLALNCLPASSERIDIINKDRFCSFLFFKSAKSSRLATVYILKTLNCNSLFFIVRFPYNELQIRSATFLFLLIVYTHILYIKEYNSLFNYTK